MAKKTKEEKRRATKAALHSTALFVGLFGVAAAVTFFLIPKKAATVIQEGAEEGGDEEFNIVDNRTGIERFVSSLADSAASGLELDFNRLSAYFPGADGALNSEKGNLIDAKGTSMKFSMDAISLHGIDLALNAPVNYNGKNRSLGLSLVDDNLYFNVKNLDEDNWNLKYKVSVASYDETDSEGNEVTDPTTGGVVQFEYGDLDWIIEDILSILTDGGIDVSFPSIDLTGSSDSSSGSSSSSSFDTDSLLSSLNEMEEDEANSYFTWELPLGDTVLPIGFSHDENYSLTRIDFPAKTGTSKNQQAAYEFKDGSDLICTIQASATVQSGSTAVNWNEAIPADAASYHDLRNSASLFEKVARYAVTPKFGLETIHGDSKENGLLLTHYKSSSVDSGATLTEDDVIEKATFDLRGSADFTDWKANSFDAAIAFASENSTFSLSGAYTDSKDAYVNVNNILKAKTSKVTMDELYARISDAVESSSDSAGQTEKQLDGVSGLIGKVMDEVKTPDVVSEIMDGHYEGVLDFIDSIDSGDSRLAITITLEPLNIDGKITIALDGTYENGKDTHLTGITFDGVMLSSFRLDGTLKLAEYKAPSIEDADYEELTHLVGIADQIEDIAGSKEAALSFSGYVHTGETDEFGSAIGADFSGTAAFDVDSLSGGASFTVHQVSEHYSQDHHAKLAFDNGEDDADYNALYFSYDSSNEDFIADSLGSQSGKDSLGKSRTNPKSDPIKGYLPISSIQSVIDTVSNLIPSEEESDDSLFDSAVSAASSLVGGDLTSNLIDREYFGLLDNDVLKSASVNGDANEFVLNGSLFGLEEDPKISIAYESNSAEKEGGFQSLTFSMENVSVTLSLDKTSNVSSEELHPFGTNPDLAGFTDFSSLSTLVEYGVGSSDLGRSASCDYSTYDFCLDVNLTLGDYTLTPFSIESYLYISDSEVKAVLSIHGIPLIKGVNAPDSSIYFRGQEYEGTRDVDVYYHHGGTASEEGGDLLITRDSSYGRVRNVKDTVAMTGNEFVGTYTGSEARSYSRNALGWILAYALGVNDEFFVPEEGSSTSSSSSSISIGLFQDSFAHPEDFLLDYTYDASKISWGLGVDVGELFGESILGDATIELSGANVTNAAGTENWKSLTSFEVGFGLTLGGKLKVCSASIVASLKNISAQGFYSDCWSESGYQDDFSALATSFGGLYHYTGSDLPGNHYAGVSAY